jgi:uncharacterized membrane protein YccC
MLSEPKSKQKNIRELNQFVVMNQMLTSHIATLSSYAQTIPSALPANDYEPLTRSILFNLDYAQAVLKHEYLDELAFDQKESFRTVNDRLNELVATRKDELEHGIIESDTRKKLSSIKPITDQFNFIQKISIELGKVSASLANFD